MTAQGDARLVCRGIRGATTAAANTAEDILEATQELVTALIASGRGSDDYSALAKVVFELAGLADSESA